MHTPLFLALALILGTAPLQAAPPAAPADVAAYASSLLDNNYADTAPGAAVLVMRGDEVLFRGADGLADLATGRKLSADDTFQIGSVSKQFSAAGLLTLVEAGKVALADPLSKYVADFPNGEHITVLQLLNHTSGVKSYTGIGSVMAGPLEKDLSTAQLIATFRDEKPDFAPGAGWAYNNSGYVLLGAVIEAASGQPWHEYLRTALFEPLGLAHTGYGGDPALAAVQVKGYAQEDGKFVAPQKLSMTFPHAAGALVSTVDDLAKWNRALHEGRVLESETYTQMITPVGKAIDDRYGFGIGQDIVRGQAMLSHGGGIPGFASMLDYVPGPDVSVVVLQNSIGNQGNDAPEDLARKLVAAALGQPFPLPVAIEVDAATLAEIEGVYPVDDKATRTLRVVDGGLTGQRTGGARARITPIGKDEYLYADGLNRFTIQRDAAGAVTGMNFFANGEDPAVFVKRASTELPAARLAIELPAPAIARVLGTYTSAGPEMKVYQEGKQLKAQMSGQPPVDVFAESPTMFFLTVVDATLEFKGGANPATGMTLRQGGVTLEFARAP